LNNYAPVIELEIKAKENPHAGRPGKVGGSAPGRGHQGQSRSQITDKRSANLWSRSRAAAIRRRIVEEDLDNEIHSEIIQYQNFGYIGLNKNLRNGTNISKGNKETIEALDTAISISPPLENPMIAYRAVPSNSVEKLAQKLVPGRSFTDKAYVSTSLLKDYAFPGDEGTSTAILFALHLPVGMRGISFRDNSEAEFLLPRDCRFTVRHIKNEGGKILVDAVVSKDDTHNQKMYYIDNIEVAISNTRETIETKARTSSTSKAFVKALQDVFEEQKEEILQSFHHTTKKSEDQKALTLHFDWAKADKRLSDASKPHVVKVFKEGWTKAQHELAQYGSKWNIERPHVQQAIDKQVLKFSFKVNKVTKEQVREVLKTAESEGQTVGDVADSLEEIFKFAKRFRAIRIAKTEMKNAAESGHQEQWEASGVVEGNQWKCSPNACKSCRELNNKVVKIGEDFTPGITRPTLHPNCDCFLSAVLKKQYRRVFKSLERKVGWYGVDLDGTLAYYAGYQGDTVIGDPIPRMITRVKEWLTDGKDVRIFTARMSMQNAPAIQQAIEQWCEKYIGQILPVTCRKDPQMIEMWDDRAVRVEQNSGVVK